MTFRSSLIGLARRHTPPPKGAASRSDTKLHVTASWKPAAAAARRRRRASNWSAVAVGLATPSARGSGVEGIASKPGNRSEERRGGKERVSTCRPQWSPRLSQNTGKHGKKDPQ